MNQTSFPRNQDILNTLRLFCPCLLVITVVVSSVCAKDIVLSGEQDGFFEKAEYLVVKPVVVKKGSTIGFAAGSVVRFSPFTGMIVEGAISCQGTQGEPVVFTSAGNRMPPADAQALPSPFDWNGIECADSSDSCVLSFVQVSFSTYGINVKNPATTVKLDNAVFFKNGRTDLTLAGKEISVKDNEPFNFKAAPKPAAVPPLVAEKNGNETPKKFSWKLGARIGCGSLAAIGIGLGLYGHFTAESNYSASQSSTQSAEAEEYWKKTQDAVVLRNIGYIAAALGAAGFGVTFFF